MQHIPVLLHELISFLSPRQDGKYIDCTFGAGGHSSAILDTPGTRILAIDRDNNYGQSVADGLNKKYGSNRVVFQNQLFSNIDKVAIENNFCNVDGVIYDIGVSSMQLDQDDRGFSFSKNGNLSMEMGLNNVSAYDIVNSFPEEELANIIYNYGDERKSRIIAKRICEHRAKNKISSTLELSDIVKKAVGRYNDTIHPATRTFQAIRIAVNNELQELEMSIKKAVDLLEDNGIIAVITFHSLEDAIVKNVFKNLSGYVKEDFDRNYIGVREKSLMMDKKIELLTKKPITACDAEIKANPRARSAKLRAAKKLNSI